MMERDNGKIRITVRDGIPIIDVYHTGELQLTDVEWINHTLLNDIEPPLSLPINIIVDRSGSYSLSEDAYINMQALMQEAAQVAYVIHRPIQKQVINFAKKSYLSDKHVETFTSIEDAQKWLQQVS